jgi:hypothetical protein
VYTTVIILAVVLVNTNSHNTMANLVTTVYQLWLPQPTCKSFAVSESEEAFFCSHFGYTSELDSLSL